MSVPSSTARSDLYNGLVAAEAHQLAGICVEHFSVPLIAGLSLEGITQDDYEKMGGEGLKPEPLSNAKKLEIYQKIDSFFRSELTKKISEMIKSIGDQWFRSLTDRELQAKYAKLKNATPNYPNWNRLKDLFKDHLCLFKEFKKEKVSPIDPETVHNQLCPLMERFRDTGALFKCIELDQLVKPDDHSEKKYREEEPDEFEM